MVLRNLNAEQARLGLTDEMLADELGIVRQTYSLKKENNSFTVSEAKKLTEIFKVDFEYLFKEFED